MTGLLLLGLRRVIIADANAFEIVHAGTPNFGIALMSILMGGRSSSVRTVLLPSDRLMELTRCSGIAFKGSVKHPQCDSISVGCTRPEFQFLLDTLRQLLLSNISVAIRDRLCARPARQITALAGLPRRHECRRSEAQHFAQSRGSTLATRKDQKRMPRKQRAEVMTKGATKLPVP